jgi:hypothetical protein
MSCLLECVENKQQNVLNSVLLYFSCTTVRTCFDKTCYIANSLYSTPVRGFCRTSYDLSPTVLKLKWLLLPEDGIVLRKHVGAVVKKNKEV